MAVFREGTNKTWAAFALTVIVIALGFDFYWLFTESGPIARMAAIEARHLDGDWYPKITLMVLFLGEIGVLLIIKLAIELATGKKLTQSLLKK